MGIKKKEKTVHRETIVGGGTAQLKKKSLLKHITRHQPRRLKCILIHTSRRVALHTATMHDADFLYTQIPFS